MDFRDKPQFAEHYEIVDNHLTKYFEGAGINVFHEMPTLDIHMDVYHIRPEDVGFELLVTSGKVKNTQLKLIPYYLWSNRGVNKMKVWMILTESN